MKPFGFGRDDKLSSEPQMHGLRRDVGTLVRDGRLRAGMLQGEEFEGAALAVGEGGGELAAEEERVGE